MNSELDQKLCAKYPKIFRDRYADMRTTAMCWGFDHGNGWYNIIDALCANIQHHIDWSRNRKAQALRYNRALKKAFDGDETGLLSYFTFNKDNRRAKQWSEYAIETVKQELARGIPHFRPVPEACPQVVATQVKEKFGTLRFYYSGGDDYCLGAESLAASMSAMTCEECGNTGRTLTQGWFRTLCKTHALEQGYDWEIEEEDEDQISK